MIWRTLVIVLLALPAFGHDFWIEPSAYRPAPGSVVALELLVGEHFKGDRIAVRPERIERFVARSASGEAEVNASRQVVFSAPATIVVYRGRPNRVELVAGKFEQYLREEGLEWVIAERKARGESALPGRELFSRCAKTLLGTGDQASGLRLEIVRREAGFSVTFEGKPLANSLVVAMPKGGGAVLRGRTDERGFVALPVTSGVWLVKTVHMVRLVPATGNADWESLWASVSFER